MRCFKSSPCLKTEIEVFKEFRHLAEAIFRETVNIFRITPSEYLKTAEGLVTQQGSA